MWVFASIVIAVMVIIGIKRWDRVSDPMADMSSRNRKAWLTASVDANAVVDDFDDSDDFMNDDGFFDHDNCLTPGSPCYSVCNDDDWP